MLQHNTEFHFSPGYSWLQTTNYCRVSVCPTTWVIPRSYIKPRLCLCLPILVFLPWCSLFPKIPVSLGKKYKDEAWFEFMLKLLSFQDTSPHEAHVPLPSGPACTDSEEIQRETAYPDGKVKWALGARQLLWKRNECASVMVQYWPWIMYLLGWKDFEKWLSPHIFPQRDMEKSGFWWEDHNYNLLQRGCEAGYAWSNSGTYPASSALFYKYLFMHTCVHSHEISH